MSDRQYGPYSAERVFRIGEGLRIPLRRVSSYSGMPQYLAGSYGVLLSEPGALSLRSHDLRAELWRREESDTSGFSPVFRVDDVFVAGPFDGEIRKYAVSTGAVLAGAIYGGQGMVVAVCDDVVVVQDPFESCVEGLSWDGQLAWRVGGKAGQVVSTREVVLVTDALDTTLRCFDGMTGHTRWTFVAPGGTGGSCHRSNAILAGLPGVAVVDDRVIVTVRDFRVFSLSLEAGEIMGMASVPFKGPFLVTRDRMFFKQPFGLSEFDHREMREVDRIEYRGDVEPLYGDEERTVSAFWLTKESILWSTLRGSLMGVARAVEPHGRRRVWVERMPGAVATIGDPPRSFGEFLYFRQVDSAGSWLVCWQGQGQ